MDKDGNQIHAWMKPNIYANHSATLTDQNVILIRHFNIAPFKGGYRPVPGDKRLYLTAHTTVRLAPEKEDFPRYKFHLTELKDLRSALQIDTHLTDIMGKLVSMSERQMKRKRNDYECAIREIYVENEWGTVTRITLWGEAADQLTDEMLKDEQLNVVLIITSTRVREYGVCRLGYSI
ncbi:hypothetical protein MKX01_005417 [Papaver californicum]|nr:hypothetical protein MKX01_005417 [Papaver californicum]